MNWTEFLDNIGVEYVTSGPNTAKGEISIQCPWCGDDDPSQHLGINPGKDVWGCLRDPEHRGTKWALVQALTGLSILHAKELIKAYSVPDPDSAEIDNIVAAFNKPTKVLFQSDHILPRWKPPKVKLPEEFKMITGEGTTRRFARYLEKRGFDRVAKMAWDYRLLCASTGQYKDRVIFPFYKGGDLVGWTGRALGNPKSGLRYLSSGDAVKKTVMWEDDLQSGGDGVLIITEGPFDALKMDYYSPPKVRATCCFGTSFSTAQLLILSRLMSRFLKVIILFDPGAEGPGFQLQESLPHGSQLVFSDEGSKDPGDWDKETIECFCRQYC